MRHGNWLYFEVRELKRRVMFQSPEIDFHQIACVDAPYTHRSPETHGTMDQTERVHESRFRAEMCATHGAKLLVLEDFANNPAPRHFAPPDGFGQPVAMFSFDISFDGRRAAVLHETGEREGLSSLRNRAGRKELQADYLGRLLRHRSNLSAGWPLPVPLSAEVYAQCGMWAQPYPDPLRRERLEYLHSQSRHGTGLLAVVARRRARDRTLRWEYIDKFANRIQALLDDASGWHGGAYVLGQPVGLSRSPWRSAADSRQRAA